MSQNPALIRMANQIGRNYSYLTESEAAAAVANHLRRFWTPEMRAEFLAGPRDELDPVAEQAAVLLAG